VAALFAYFACPSGPFLLLLFSVAVAVAVLFFIFQGVIPSAARNPRAAQISRAEGVNLFV
jgi:hypothetical protein